ncbi:MAG: hypothetical protein KDC92_00435, partial [Bacteroidetes bacterium]|nr:hypothetical protein [Bacteroidota bacterium]
MKINYFVFLFTIITSGTLKAQISYENRVEFELKDGYTDEKIYEFGKAGFIMVSRSEKANNGDFEWKFEQFSVDLKSVKTKSIFLSNKLSLIETYRNNERIHSLFKDRKGNFKLITTDANSLIITEAIGELPKKAWVQDMSVLSDYAFFKTTIKRAPFLFSVNWKTGKKKLIPISIENVSAKKTTLMNFQVLESSSEVFVYTSALIGKRKTDIHVIRLNFRGEKEGSFNLTKNIDANIIDISASKLTDNEYIYTGTYSKNNTATSEGIFICKASRDQVAFFEMHNFLDLENFLKTQMIINEAIINEKVFEIFSLTPSDKVIVENSEGKSIGSLPV